MNTPQSAPSQISDDREARIQALLERLRPNTEAVLRQMAERLVDLPEEKSFGLIEHELRDLAHDFASSAHQAGLQAGKKRATRVRVSSARTAAKTPVSLNTVKRPG